MLHPGWHAANPGFPKDYWILYCQQSQPLYNGSATITFKYDSVLVFDSCNNNGIHNAFNHTVTWSVSNIPYAIWNWNTRPHAYFTVPANVSVNYPLIQEFWISPSANDCDSSDNHCFFIAPVSGSKDPNAKVVSPVGDIQEEDSTLTYTIHFQNTGNDTTWFITIKDTLSPYLSPASVVNIASSHEYVSFDISGTGILTWLFNPIYLVDSATNEPDSKGFVSFRVNKKTGLPVNAEISNRASIYFDYNEPILTNTVINKIVAPDGVSKLSLNTAIQVFAFPNPFSQTTTINVQGITGSFSFELYDVTGKLLKARTAITDSIFTLQRETMTTGVYFYKVTTKDNRQVYGRLLIQ